jgi:integrase
MLFDSFLTADEQRLILRATAGKLRDHMIISLALGIALRLAEIFGLDVGDVFAPDGTPRVRVRVRAAIAKGGRAADPHSGSMPFESHGRNSRRW